MLFWGILVGLLGLAFGLLAVLGDRLTWKRRLGRRPSPWFFLMQRPPDEPPRRRPEADFTVDRDGIARPTDD